MCRERGSHFCSGRSMTRHNTKKGSLPPWHSLLSQSPSSSLSGILPTEKPPSKSNPFPYGGTEASSLCGLTSFSSAERKHFKIAWTPARQIVQTSLKWWSSPSKKTTWPWNRTARQHSEWTALLPFRNCIRPLSSLPLTWSLMWDMVRFTVWHSETTAAYELIAACCCNSLFTVFSTRNHVTGATVVVVREQ